MLFLDTYEVNAAVPFVTTSNDFSIPFTLAFPNTYYSSGYGSISNGTGSISVTDRNGGSGATFHVSIPVEYTANLGGGIDNMDNVAWASSIANFSVTNSKFHYYNLCLKDREGNILSTGSYSSAQNTNWNVTKYYQLFNLNVGGIGYPLTVEFDLSVDNSYNGYENGSFNFRIYTIFNDGSSITGDYDYKVYDPTTSQQLNNLNQSSKAIEESVTSESGGGLLATIKSFFGSFFQNVIDSFKSLFIPEDGYFTNWFNRLNTLLADKLGMLYAPFDLVISTLNAIMNADSSETGIPFPGIKWEDTWLIEPFTFTFSSLGEDMSDLRDTVYFATDVVLLFAFLYLLEEKIRHILED